MQETRLVLFPRSFNDSNSNDETFMEPGATTSLVSSMTLELELSLEKTLAKWFVQTAAAQAEMALIDDDITRRLTETKKRCKKELAEQKEKKDKVPAKSLDARIAD